MRILLLAAIAGCAFGQASSVEEIMQRVAANQDSAQDLRKQWIYNQKQVLRMIRGNGKLAREERREYLILPRRKRTSRELVKFEGKYESHGKYIPFNEPGYEYKDIDIDADVIDSLSEDLTNDKGSHDGISPDLFPLTAKEQRKYDFQLVARETYRERPVLRIKFLPKRHPPDGDTGSWKGEALIDAEEFQPVSVHTTLAYGIPMAVKVLLGTNIKSLGFSVAYQKFADGVWFPVSYGGEFEVRAVFFYKRTISVSLVNSDFRHADVTTNIAFALEDK
jgi:hypothetical protein